MSLLRRKTSHGPYVLYLDIPDWREDKMPLPATEGWGQGPWRRRQVAGATSIPGLVVRNGGGTSCFEPQLHSLLWPLARCQFPDL
jgi:hypothetical protein